MKPLFPKKQIKLVIIGGRKNRKRVKLVDESKKQCKDADCNSWWIQTSSWFIMMCLGIIAGPLFILEKCCALFADSIPINRFHSCLFLNATMNGCYFALYESLRIDVLETFEHLIFIFIEASFSIMLHALFKSSLTNRIITYCGVSLRRKRFYA